jgi:hypothetical protein
MALMQKLVWFVLKTLVLAAVCFLLLWLNDKIPVPEPFHWVVRVAVLVVGVFALIFLLLEAIGYPLLPPGKTQPPG